MTSIIPKFQTRADLLNLSINFALLAGIAMSWRLWFPVGRFFPTVPLFVSASNSVTYFLSALLIVAIVLTIIKVNRLAMVLLLTILVLLDQMRLQPWVYQYFILLLLIALSRDDGLLRKCQQLVVASLYFWSGIQKLNYNFHQEVLPQLLAPWTSLASIGQKQLLVLGAVIALIEVLTGLGLLFKRTRKVFVWVAIAMHVGVLALLIKLGHNSVVWTWNVAMIVFVVLLFWRVQDSTYSHLSGNNKRSVSMLTITACVIGLPILNFFGWWDLYLSGALYSGTARVAVIRLDEKTIVKLSPQAQRAVFTSKSNERFLPLFEWSLAELNVPPNPEQRVFAKVAKDVCGQTENNAQIELIVREHKSRFGAGFDVKRWDCAGNEVRTVRR